MINDVAPEMHRFLTFSPKRNEQKSCTAGPSFNDQIGTFQYARRHIFSILAETVGRPRYQRHLEQWELLVVAFFGAHR